MRYTQSEIEAILTDLDLREFYPATVSITSLHFDRGVLVEVKIFGFEQSSQHLEREFDDQRSLVHWIRGQIIPGLIKDTLREAMGLKL